MNVVFLLADDMGSWAMGCSGNREILTPNLDRLSASGAQCDNAFCVSPVCSPARASILTGRIPSQHGIHDWIRRGNSPVESNDGAVINYLEGQPTVTGILAANGYDCGLSGKWHLGNAMTAQAGHRFWRTHSSGGGPYYNAPMVRDGVEYKEPRYVTSAITDNALQFLRQQRSVPRPFYLGVHYTAPHSPWGRKHHPAQYFNPYFDECPLVSTPDLPMHPWQIDTTPFGTTPAIRREILSGYYASITAMDAEIGRLLDFLEEAGLAEETLVVFTSDNGMNMGHHGIYGKGNGTYPQNMYDTSVKVPLLASCRGIIPAGSKLSGLLSHYDVLPTLLDFLGFPEQIPPGLPGRSHAPQWRGEQFDRHSEIVVFDEYGPVRMIRTLKEKYIHRFPDGPHEFYDLEFDPDENNNLAGLPEYQGNIGRLRERLERWFSNHVDARFDGILLPVTGKGQLDRLDRPSERHFQDDWRYLNEQILASSTNQRFETHVIQRDLNYLSDDRREKLDAYLPPGRFSRPVPAVIWIHGGGWKAGDKAERREVNICQFLAEHGYAAFSINYYLGDCERPPDTSLKCSAGKAAPWPANFFDCKSALRFIRRESKRFGINPERIAVSGASAGGHLALLVGMTAQSPEMNAKGLHLNQDNHVSCILDFYGVADVSSAERMRHFCGATDAQTTSNVKAASPSTYIHEKCPPMLIVHGSRDEVIPVDISRKFVELIDQRGIEQQFVEVPGASHSFDFQPREMDLRPVVLDFLRMHLGSPRLRKTAP